MTEQMEGFQELLRSIQSKTKGNTKSRAKGGRAKGKSAMKRAGAKALAKKKVGKTKFIKKQVGKKLVSKKTLAASLDVTLTEGHSFGIYERFDTSKMPDAGAVAP